MESDGKLVLLSADICRDGGSIAVEYRQPDGSLRSVMLEVVEIPDFGQPRRFSHLHVGSTIQTDCDPSTIVPKGSVEEASLMSDLEVLWSNYHPPHLGRSIDHLRDLRRFLLTRSG